MSDKFTISILGTGNVASHLARAFIKADVQVQYIVSRNRERAVEIAKQYGARGIDYSDIHLCHSDVVFLCVSDDAIYETSAFLKQSKSTIVHTSGSTGIEILIPQIENCGVVYPLQTFTKGRDIDYQQIPFFIEASSENVKSELFALARRITDKVFDLDSERRKILHIAAVFACNFSNHMAAIGSEIVGDAGMGFEILRPLIQETLLKLDSILPMDAQTGPASRGDEKILNDHLNFLGTRPNEKELYKLISESIILYNKKRYE